MVASLSTHTDRLVEARRRRLDELEVRAARDGYTTPPEVATEIADLQRMLAGQDAPPIAEADRYQAVLRAVMLLSQQVAAVEVKVARLMWLLPAMLFAYLILSFVLEHLP